MFDNNEPGLFYLHEDRSSGVHLSCCVVLSLSISLKAEHYDMLLAAKTAQLREPFQAKLGWLVGNMYSRVGTTEWDTEIAEPKCRQQADKLLGDTFVVLSDEQIAEGVAALKLDGELAQRRPEEILEFIKKTRVKPRSTRLLERAAEVISQNQQLRPLNQVRGRLTTALRSGVLHSEILGALSAAEVAEPKGLADQLVRLFEERLNSELADGKLEGREDILVGLLRGILSDAKVARILK